LDPEDLHLMDFVVLEDHLGEIGDQEAHHPQECFPVDHQVHLALGALHHLIGEDQIRISAIVLHLENVVIQGMDFSEVRRHQEDLGHEDLQINSLMENLCQMAHQGVQDQICLWDHAHLECDQLDQLIMVSLLKMILDQMIFKI